ncbi:MAG: EamA family transporter, partial [Blastomonas sp.]|nr:EamA family transporter [Blastomonas sp.]
MLASDLYRTAPLGAKIRFSNGAPRPPDRFKRKLSACEEENGTGTLVEWRPGLAGSATSLPATFGLHIATYASSGVPVLVIRRIYTIASLLDFSALKYISAQFDRLILLTYPFFVVLFGAVFFKRRVTPAMIGALLVSYAGIALIFWHDLTIEGENVVLGAALVFGSALAYAGYQILAKPLIDRLGSGLFTSIAMSAAGPCVIVH